MTMIREMTRRETSRKLVALHGLPRAGKDTLADALVAEAKFRKAAFADSLYEEVAEAFGVKVGELRSNTWKTEPQNLLSLHCCDSLKFRAAMEARKQDASEPRTSRYLLQRWAHEYRNGENHLYWVEQFRQRVWSYDGSLVVPDLRYEETEYAFLVAFAKATHRELTILQVDRPGVVRQGNHKSDDPLPHYCIDMTVTNYDGDPDRMICDAFNYLGIGRARG